LFSTSAFSFDFHVQYILYNLIPFEVQNDTQLPVLKFNFSLFFTLYNRPWLIFTLVIFCSIFAQLNKLIPNCSVVSISCPDRSLAVGQSHVHGTLPNFENQISKASNIGGSAHIDA
jgi:hypothetical protein